MSQYNTNQKGTYGNIWEKVIWPLVAKSCGIYTIEGTEAENLSQHVDAHMILGLDQPIEKIDVKGIKRDEFPFMRIELMGKEGKIGWLLKSKSKYIVQFFTIENYKKVIFKIFELSDLRLAVEENVKEEFTHDFLDSYKKKYIRKDSNGDLTTTLKVNTELFSIYSAEVKPGIINVKMFKGIEQKYIPYPCKQHLLTLK